MSDFVFPPQLPRISKEPAPAIRKFLNEWVYADEGLCWWAIDQAGIFANPRDTPRWRIEKRPSNGYVWCGSKFATFEQARDYVVDRIAAWVRGPYGPPARRARWLTLSDLEKVSRGDRIAVTTDDGQVHDGVVQSVAQAADKTTITATRATYPPVERFLVCGCGTCQAIERNRQTRSADKYSVRRRKA
ncbi:hypothetical protein CH298_13315 [Rhodococcoides fascians]|uniref:hypothetical protein n=1 Tax=Rhodococcoides fascians TaxID=1828 RepID=UPI000B9BBF52|nr:hypothetical protein [Rhodococcus fascians]OZE89958.1 hypothetical protein CH303_13195 [Rhodococcus fascians]OZF18265.1 hypothetical protein CH298_13315 [Rhodococcus fascians]OZF21716.1 hypothetical protein CH297_13210 [Rhodococcus fascians]OZF67341.1 hypothetical protein CH308_13110 [Rhodococcus fascians]OZF70531.1 hypothetical protein CH307_13310 [Rhodococcus fascians]